MRRFYRKLAQFFPIERNRYLFLEMNPASLALRLERAPLELEDAVLYPVVNAWGKRGTESSHEDEEAEDQGVANRDDGGKNNDEYKGEDVDVAGVC